MSSLRSYSFSELLTFTRASVANYCNSLGVLAAAAVDEPRIEYDAETLAVRGLLMEEERTNYLLRSQEFSNASWTKTRASVTPDAVAAPDGTLTADKLVEDGTAANTHYAMQSYTKTASNEVQTYCASVWAKAGGQTWIRLNCQGTSGAANSAYANFNLSTGAASTPQLAGAYDNAQARMDKWPGGWYRCSLDFRINNDAQAAVEVWTMLYTGSSSLYNGDGASGAYLWGAQLEKGTYPTSYVSTTTVAVARSRDVCAMTSLGDWFTEDAGTVLAEYLIPWTVLATDAALRRLVQADDASEVDRDVLYLEGGSRKGLLTASSAAQASFSQAGIAAGVVQKQAMAWATDNMAQAASGGYFSSDTSATVPTDLTAFRLGNASAAGSELNGYLRKVKFYPRRLSDNELRALVA